jgi:flagellar motor switch protein FliG
MTAPYDPADGRSKAAILLLALGDEICGKLFAKMDEEEVREISLAMAQLGSIPAYIVEQICAEFLGGFGGSGALIGTYETTEQLLRRTLPAGRADQIMEEIRGPAGRTMWEKLGNVNEVLLANYLKNEYPQTVAVVLSKVRSDHAARVLGLLPDSFALDVIMRMLRMETVQKDVLAGVERTLRYEFMSNLDRSTKRDAYEVMADIFNNLDRTTENRFTTALEERSREAAERIKALMFTFDDLQRLSGTAVQILIRTAPRDRLPIALKGAAAPVREVFFSNLSERAANILREEIENLGPIRLRDVDDAQATIVAAAKELAAQGQISIRESKDEELVY